MNYRDFMKQVNDNLSRMSEEEKNDWIRDAARKTHENKRQTFLDTLMNTETQTNYLSHSAMNEIEAWCKKIKNRDIYIECIGYEAYGEGHYGEWINEYSDVFGVGKELSKHFRLQKICYI
ncbi:hypothetical protein [Pseudogracilibacillus sp. SO30301A]|uniref:hypothetical protein n=1 Tax=Pseudogracilibacillus sp. SO30301A TaxID=3098291 RepID=UPI00300E690C